MLIRFLCGRVGPLFASAEQGTQAHWEFQLIGGGIVCPHFSHHHYRLVVLVGRGEVGRVRMCKAREIDQFV